MLVLFETAGGFAVFKLLDEKKLENVGNLAQSFETGDAASNVVELLDFHKFRDATEALTATLAINEGNMCKSLKTLIKKVMKKELHDKLVVLDSKLGSSIKSKFSDLEIISTSNVSELIRCIRGQMTSLIPGITEKESSAMMLGLGHNMARYRLKFSPDKVDIMVVQAVKLLDDLDKELNNYVMRAKEWYGWHFPELAKILTDNSSYINTIITMGFRENAMDVELPFLSEELSSRVKEAAEVSMGSEISDMDIKYMRELCAQILGLTDYRAHLYEYLNNRMMSLAPNVTILVGELIGARLIAHSGSLINLAKNPASTIQLIGAEKALFRALKTRKSTPKYGLLYHADLISKSPTASKGRMARMLAAKVALGCRVDAIGEDTGGNIDFGSNCRATLTKKIGHWTGGKATQISGQSKHFNPATHYPDSQAHENHYSGRQDSTISGVKRERPQDEAETLPKKKQKKNKQLVTEIKEETAEPAKKKKKKSKSTEEDADEGTASVKQEEEQAAVAGSSEKKKKKKKNKEALMETETVGEEQPSTEKKKKKKKSTEVNEEEAEDVPAASELSGEKKKKKKKKQREEE